MRTIYNSKWQLTLLVMIFIVQGNLLAQANIKYTLVNPVTNELTISNLGDVTQDVGDYWLCLGPGTYAQVNTNTAESTNLAPGNSVLVHYTMNENADGLSLFATGSFGSSDPNELLDYVQWGAANQPRVSQAVTAGRWGDAANFVIGLAPYTTTVGGSAEVWLDSCDAEAAAIQITGTADTETTICAGDGEADPIDVEIVGTGVGANSGWVITDAASGLILGLPPGPPFDLEGAGEGVCNIYYIRYADGLAGLEVNEVATIGDLEGCFDLSNPVAINRNDPDAAEIQLVGGGTEVDTCAGDGSDDLIDVEIVGEGVGANRGWLITDNVTGEILGLPEAPPFNLEGAGAGVCAIWYIRYADGLQGLEGGMNVNDLDGCFDLSNPVLVDREGVDAVAIQITGTASTETTICAGDGEADPIDVEIVGTGVGANSGWVITDAASGLILGLPPGPPFDLEGAGEGVCNIYYIRYADGLAGLEVNEVATIGDLEGCFDLSNSVSVTRLVGEDCEVLSTVSFDLDEGLTTYPNPVQDELNVVTRNLEGQLGVAIYDLSGKQVSRTILEKEQRTLTMSQLTAGIYFVSFTDRKNGSTAVRQVVKQ